MAYECSMSRQSPRGISNGSWYLRLTKTVERPALFYFGIQQAIPRALLGSNLHGWGQMHHLRRDSTCWQNPVIRSKYHELATNVWCHLEMSWYQWINKFGANTFFLTKPFCSPKGDVNHHYVIYRRSRLNPGSKAGHCEPGHQLPWLSKALLMKCIFENKTWLRRI